MKQYVVTPASFSVNTQCRIDDAWFEGNAVGGISTRVSTELLVTPGNTRDVRGGFVVHPRARARGGDDVVTPNDVPIVQVHTPCIVASGLSESVLRP